MSDNGGINERFENCKNDIMLGFSTTVCRTVLRSSIKLLFTSKMCNGLSNRINYSIIMMVDKDKISGLATLHQFVRHNL